MVVFVFIATADLTNAGVRKLSEPALAVRFLIGVGRKFIPTKSPCPPAAAAPAVVPVLAAALADGAIPPNAASVDSEISTDATVDGAVTEDLEETATTEAPQDDFDDLFPSDISENNGEEQGVTEEAGTEPAIKEVTTDAKVGVPTDAPEKID